MLNPPLTAADVGRLFETTCGKQAFVIYGPEDDDEFLVGIAGGPVRYVDASGKGEDITLARRLPTSDPITELERRVVEAAVARRLAGTGASYAASMVLLSDATHALIAARRPRARRVDSPEALQAALVAVGWGASTAMAAKHLFNALPEVGE